MEVSPTGGVEGEQLMFECLGFGHVSTFFPEEWRTSTVNSHARGTVGIPLSWEVSPTEGVEGVEFMFLNVSNPSSMDAAQDSWDASVCKSSCVKNSRRAFASYWVLTGVVYDGGVADVAFGRTRGGASYGKAWMLARFFSEVLEEEEVLGVPELPELLEMIEPEVAAILEIEPVVAAMLEIKQEVKIESADSVVEEKPRVDFVEMPRGATVEEEKPVLSVLELEVVDMDFACV